MSADRIAGSHSSATPDNVFVASLNTLKSRTVPEKAISEFAQSGHVAGTLAPLDEMAKKGRLDLHDNILQSEEEFGDSSCAGVVFKKVFVLSEKLMRKSVPAGYEIAEKLVEIVANGGTLAKLAHEPAEG